MVKSNLIVFTFPIGEIVAKVVDTLGLSESTKHSFEPIPLFYVRLFILTIMIINIIKL